MKSIYFALILCIVYSCSTNINNPIEQIFIKQEYSKDIKLSSYAKEIKYISLESKEEALISKIWKIDICDDYLFIFTKKNNEPIFIFDTCGIFIRKIALPGRGPGEFPSSIVDFSIDRQIKKLLILGSNNEILEYNFSGEFLKKIKINGFASHLEMYNDRIYLNFVYPDHYSNKGYSISILNSSGEQMNRLFNCNYLHTTLNEFNNSPRSALGILQEFNDTITYWESRLDTIFKIYKEKIYPKYVLKIDKPIRLEVRAFFENDNYIFLPYIFYQNKLNIYIFNKNSKLGNLYAFPTDKVELTQFYFSINDIDGGWPFFPRGYCQGWIWDYYSPYQLLEYQGKDNLNWKTGKIEKSEYLKNPVIMLVR